jgi:hypothetical protein
MFSCFNPYQTDGPKCEWQGGNLRNFVKAFNEERGTTYGLEECLDVYASDRSHVRDKQPEVLVTGARGEQPMVIERKQVVSEAYARHHRNQHLIGEMIPELIWPHFSKDLYLLEINDCDLRDKTKSKVHTEIRQIADQIIAKCGLVVEGKSISGSSPFAWRFRRVPIIDRDETMPDAGIGVTIHGTGVVFDQNIIVASGRARAEYSALVNRCIAEAGLKFEMYLDHRKVVVLEFYGDLMLLDEDDAKEIVREMTLPPAIDEVWISTPQWISESDYEVDYERVC